MSRQFTYGKGHGGNHYIFAPNGVPVIRYWWFYGQRIGNMREYNAEFVRGKDRTIACVYGGLTRSLVKYLNTGQFANANDATDLYSSETVERLDCLRKRFSSR